MKVSLVNWIVLCTLLKFLVIVRCATIQDISVSATHSTWGHALAPGLGGFDDPASILESIFDTSNDERYVGLINYHQDAANSTVVVRCATQPFLPAVGQIVILNQTLAYHDAVIIHVDYFNTNIICNATLGSVIKMFPVAVYLGITFQPIRVFNLLQDLTAIGIPY